jgi:2-oxoglutarate dehydrogenase E1 component
MPKAPGPDFLHRSNAAYIEQLYEQYRRDPTSVGEDWRLVFAGFDLASGDGSSGPTVAGTSVAVDAAETPPAASEAPEAASDIARGTPAGSDEAGTGTPSATSRRERMTPATGRPRELRPEATLVAPATGISSATAEAAQVAPEPTLGVFDLIHSYRELGHLIANLDPLGDNATNHPLLELDEFGFGEADLDRVVECRSFVGCEQAPLRRLIGLLRSTYCGTVAVEYMHIQAKERREWLQDRIERTQNSPQLSDRQRLHLLDIVSRANGFEHFLQTKYLGQKRFSLEGGESLVPLLTTMVEQAGNLGVEEIVMGMPHRGRLNVMANVLGKPYELIFSEFEGAFLPANVQGDGDVKYHLGYSRDYVTRNGKKVHFVLLPNPSHLEAIDPVVEGIVHAKQQYLRDSGRSRVMPLLLHGDAAFTGQGIVMETMSLSELEAYHNGGTIHVIINNQIGFTTSPTYARFTRYPSDIAKVFNAPVFHVNADDPEAAVQAARLAIEFRDRFKEDVVIDLVCYRRHGHNELDDPTFTQPVMYKKIHAKRPVHELYAQRLVDEGVTTPAEVEENAATIRRRFEKALEDARDRLPRQRVFAFGGVWEGMDWAGKDWSADTAVSRRAIDAAMAGATKLPPTFHAHPKVEKLLEARAAMLAPDGKIDWACAEMLAFATLLLEGTDVRLSGQDSGRGTFSQRHTVLHDMDTDERYVPLNKLAPEQGTFTVIDTMLSELGVLGFEYGFSSADPRNLVLWEAQYGDFVNNAQIVIDQFISSAESKWQRQNGIVLLLPHGYEGQGPEHSSARLGRFLSLCAEKNMQVCYPSTPSQYFHVLRRQIHRRFRKPLVIMAPKSLLRHKLVVSSPDELTDGRFALVLDEVEAVDPAAVRRILFCSGKVYYDLVVARRERVIDDVAIVRIEQLYPFPSDEVKAVAVRYAEDADVCWVQEEPKNMGAWQFVDPRLRKVFEPDRRVRYVGRASAASPATGSYKMHQSELDELLTKALHKTRSSQEKKANVR